MSPERRKTIIEEFQQATRELEQVLERVGAAVSTPRDEEEPSNPAVEPAESAELNQAAQQVEQAAQGAEHAVAKVQDDVAAQEARK